MGKCMSKKEGRERNGEEEDFATLREERGQGRVTPMRVKFSFCSFC